MSRQNLLVAISTLMLCLLVPCFALTSSAAEEGPEAVIQHFYKAAREGTYAEAKTHLSRESQEFIKVELYKWTAIVDTLTKNGTLQAVEVGEVTTFSPNYLGGEGTMCSLVTTFADGKSQKIRIALTKEGDVWKIFWIGKLEVEQAYQDYVISFYRHRPPFNPSMITDYFEILQSDHRVYMSRFGAGLSHFSLGHKGHFDQRNKYTEQIVAPIGKDITGNGEPNLVVVLHGGGTAGFGTYYIFEIGQEFRKIAIIDDHLGTEFTDLDGDSKLEIVVGDYAFKSFARCNACYRAPDVVLRYQDGAYRIAVDLMRKPAPSREDLEGRAQQVQENTFDNLLATMLELLYTGHPDLAWEFVEMAWPHNIGGKDDFLNQFRAKLKGSRFWPLDSKRAYFAPQR